MTLLTPTGQPEPLYRAFDLLWHSPDLLCPELPLANIMHQSQGINPAIPPPTIVRVIEEDPANWPPLPPGPHASPLLQMAPGDLRLTVEEIGHFRVSGGVTIAWSREHGGVTDQAVRTFLLGSAVGALLIQRGMLVLHGNALVKDGQAIVCMGHSGAGKSTLAYALMREGWRLLADDLVAVTPDGLVLPGIPRIKLWEDAALAFRLDPGELPAICKGMKKYLVLGEAIDRAEQATPLAALYLIQRRRDQEPQPSETNGDADADTVIDAAAKAEIETDYIQPITSQKEATLLLCCEAYRLHFVRGLGMEGNNFLELARLQRAIPVAILTLPLGIAAMRRWLEGVDLLTAAAVARRVAPSPTPRATTAKRLDFPDPPPC